MADYIFTMVRVSKFFGPERKVLDEITLAFLPGAKIGVLGPNGAGKSTVLRIMAGLEEPSSGRADLAAGASVGLLQQEPQLDESKDVRGNVEDGVRPLRDLLDRFNEISAGFAEPDADFDALLAEQAKVQEQIDRHDAWNLDAQLDRAMDALRLPDGDRDVASLSGGERRRVALCRLLLQAPDLLLLDEPTNHLDAESVAWLERFLADYPGTVVAVTHDRYFLDNVAGWILELDRGKGIPYEGNYSGWLEQKSLRLAHEEKAESARQRALKQELEWVRSAPASGCSSPATIRKSVVLPAPFGPTTPTIPAGGSENVRSSTSSRSPKPFFTPSASITRSPRRGPGGMWISTLSSFTFCSSASSFSYAPSRAFALACRARGLARTHSSSRASVRRRADSVFSSCASRSCFCSSHEE